MQVHKVDNLDASDAGVYECAAMLSNGSLLPRRWIANITVGSKLQDCMYKENAYLISTSCTLLHRYRCTSTAVRADWKKCKSDLFC